MKRDAPPVKPKAFVFQRPSQELPLLPLHFCNTTWQRHFVAQFYAAVPQSFVVRDQKKTWQHESPEKPRQNLHFVKKSLHAGSSQCRFLTAGREAAEMITVLRKQMQIKIDLLLEFVIAVLKTRRAYRGLGIAAIFKAFFVCEWSFRNCLKQLSSSSLPELQNKLLLTKACSNLSTG